MLREVLSEAVAAVADGLHLAVIRLGKGDIVLWRVRRDSFGVPRAVRSALPSGPEAAWEAARAVDGYGMVILVSASLEETETQQFLALFREIRTDLQHFLCAEGFTELLREAVSYDPLTQMYELVTLRGAPEGGFELEATPLFPVGARRGEEVRLTLRFRSGQEAPPVLALVASARDTRMFRPLTVLSAPVRSGVYRVTAQLLRPGVGRFDGLPAPLTRETRSWAELTAAIPERAGPPRSATGHLICAVETSVPDAEPERLTERIARVRQLLTGAVDAEDLRVSLVSYGAHRFVWGVPEPALPVWCWEEHPENALARLDELAAEGPQDDAYPSAAEVECVLAAVSGLLEERAETRAAALLFVGDRSPFPHRIHHSGVLPCPRRHDWRRFLADLRGRPGTRIAAICDSEETPEFWEELSDGPVFGLDAVDLAALRSSLGLPLPARGLPFPLVETE